MVAMALAGFTEERSAMWRKTCNELRLSLKNPYLRAMFAFLACDKDNFDEVLVRIFHLLYYRLFMYLEMILAVFCMNRIQ